MLKPFVYMDLSSFIELKLADSNSKIKMVGSKYVPTIWVNTQEINHGHNGIFHKLWYSQVTMVHHKYWAVSL